MSKVRSLFAQDVQQLCIMSQDTEITDAFVDAVSSHAWCIGLCSPRYFWHQTKSNYLPHHKFS